MSRVFSAGSAAKTRQANRVSGSKLRAIARSTVGRGVAASLRGAGEWLAAISGIGSRIRGFFGGGRRGVERAEQVLQEAGVQIPIAPGSSQYDEQVKRTAEEIVGRATQTSVSPPGIPPRTIAPGTTPPAPGRKPIVTPGPQWAGRAISAPPLPGEESPLSPEITTPQSSNVYSFQYDYSSSTLYVRFKAPKLNSANVSVSGSGIVSGGGAIAGRSNEMGARYAYLDVPVRVWKRLSTASSAGKAVWDELRIRGTIYGHQYRYQLIQGALVSDGAGGRGVYVPRRATVRGFRTRAVAALGKGRREWIESTLPERLTGAPNRGTPNRGTPDRG